MRAILVLAILLLGLTGAATEPKYSAFGAHLVHGNDNSSSALIDIESVTGRGDLLSLVVLEPRPLQLELFKPEPRVQFVPLNSDEDVESSAIESGTIENGAIESGTIENGTVESGTTVSGGNESSANGSRAHEPEANNATHQSDPTSIDNLCNTLLMSAQDNGLPVPFFANLLWQESQLRADDVSKKGAQGIAQFMPKVAAETGLTNPFDPMQAIPASARFLQRLRLQFGNLGFVAAAYNAGAHRVIEWLESRANLPRETRDYVVRVTGLSAETWKTMPIDNAVVTFAPRLPCRSLPAFAGVEQEQMGKAELERAKLAQAAREETAAAAPTQSTMRQARDDEHERSRHRAPLAGRERQNLKQEASKQEASKQASKREVAKRETAKREIAKHEVAKHEVANHDVAKHEVANHEVAKREGAHAGRAPHERHRSA